MYRSPHAASVLSGSAVHRAHGEFGRAPRGICRDTVDAHGLNDEQTNFGRSLAVPIIRFHIRFEGPTVDSQPVPLHQAPKPGKASSQLAWAAQNCC